jgi:hypothetical protein
MDTSSRLCTVDINFPYDERTILYELIEERLLSRESCEKIILFHFYAKVHSVW